MWNVETKNVVQFIVRLVTDVQLHDLLHYTQLNMSHFDVALTH